MNNPYLPPGVTGEDIDRVFADEEENTCFDCERPMPEGVPGVELVIPNRFKPSKRTVIYVCTDCFAERENQKAEEREAELENAALDQEPER